MDSKYPEIEPLKSYADEIKLQIETILCGNGSVTSALLKKRKDAAEGLVTLNTDLYAHAKKIVAPDSGDNKSTSTNVESIKELSTGLKLSNVLKVQDRDGYYWIYKVDCKGNPRDRKAKVKK